MKVQLSFLVATLVSGCGYADAYLTLAREDKAIKLVWYGVMEMTAPPPHFAWRLQPALWCDGDDINVQSTGFMVRAEWDTGKIYRRCVGGAYWYDAHVAEVALPDGFALHRTSFAHEAEHAALHIRGVEHGDRHHLRDVWGKGGEVERANQMLMENGL